MQLMSASADLRATAAAALHGEHATDPGASRKQMIVRLPMLSFSMVLLLRSQLTELRMAYRDATCSAAL